MHSRLARRRATGGEDHAPRDAARKDAAGAATLALIVKVAILFQVATERGAAAKNDARRRRARVKSTPFRRRIRQVKTTELQNDGSFAPYNFSGFRVGKNWLIAVAFENSAFEIRVSVWPTGASFQALGSDRVVVACRCCFFFQCTQVLCFPNRRRQRVEARRGTTRPVRAIQSEGPGSTFAERRG